MGAVGCMAARHSILFERYSPSSNIFAEVVFVQHLNGCKVPFSEHLPSRLGQMTVACVCTPGYPAHNRMPATMHMETSKPANKGVCSWSATLQHVCNKRERGPPLHIRTHAQGCLPPHACTHKAGLTQIDCALQHLVAYNNT